MKGNGIFGGGAASVPTPAQPEWDVDTLTYTGNSAAIVADYLGMAWSGDGSTTYTTAGAFGILLKQYDLSTAYLLSSLTDSGKTFDPTPMVYPSRGIFARADGSSLLIGGAVGGNVVVRKYSMTSGDLNTAADTTDQLIISPTITRPDDVFMKADGTELYVVENFPLQKVVQYTLSTPWLLASGTLTGSLDTSIGNIVDYPVSVHIKPDDGLRAFVSGIRDSDGEGLIAHYTLSTPYLISSGTHDGTLTLTSPTSYDPGNMHFHPDGTTVFFADAGDDTIYEFST